MVSCLGFRVWCLGLRVRNLLFNGYPKLSPKDLEPEVRKEEAFGVCVSLAQLNSLGRALGALGPDSCKKTIKKPRGS